MAALSNESLQAIANVHERQRMAKQRAESKFLAEQDIVAHRKSRNRIILKMIIVCGALFVANDLFSLFSSETAKPGNILAKSDLNKSQVAALNIVPAKSERKHAVNP